MKSVENQNSFQNRFSSRVKKDLSALSLGRHSLSTGKFERQLAFRNPLNLTLGDCSRISDYWSSVHADCVALDETLNGASCFLPSRPALPVGVLSLKDRASREISLMHDLALLLSSKHQLNLPF